MSGSSQFKTFAAGAGANTLTPAEYATMTDLLSGGFVEGIAESKTLNTVWRQSSFVAAAVAQLMANITGEAINDDGNITTFIAQLEATISGINPGSVYGTAGYQRLPGGFILQWGKISVYQGTLGQPVTFPITFPNACFGVLVCEEDGNAPIWGAYNPTVHAAGAPNTAGYTAWALGWNGSGWAVGSYGQFFIALGR
jgi:hypothetical protein